MIALFNATTLKRAAQLPDATYNQWRARGFVPGAYQSKGSGDPQLYTPMEILRTAVMARMVRFGIPLSEAFKLCEVIPKAGRELTRIWIEPFIDQETDQGVGSDDLYDRAIGVTLKAEYIPEVAFQRRLKYSMGCPYIALDRVRERVAEALAVGTDSLVSTVPT